MSVPYVARGEFASAKQFLTPSISKPNIPTRWASIATDLDTYALLADIAVQERDIEALQKYAPQSEELAVRDNHRLYLGIAQRAQGVLHHLTGDYQEAHARLTSALKFFEELDARWQIGQTQMELGALARAQNDLTAAFEHFNQALTAFEELRATLEIEKVRAILNEVRPF